MINTPTTGHFLLHLTSESHYIQAYLVIYSDYVVVKHCYTFLNGLSGSVIS